MECLNIQAATSPQDPNERARQVFKAFDVRSKSQRSLPCPQKSLQCLQSQRSLPAHMSAFRGPHLPPASPSPRIPGTRNSRSNGETPVPVLTTTNTISYPSLPPQARGSSAGMTRMPFSPTPPRRYAPESWTRWALFHFWGLQSERFGSPAPTAPLIGQALSMPHC